MKEKKKVDPNYKAYLYYALAVDYFLLLAGTLICIGILIKTSGWVSVCTVGLIFFITLCTLGVKTYFKFMYGEKED